MDDTRFLKLVSLFEAARDLPSDDRGRLLDAGCEGDTGLRAEVDALLARHDRAESAGSDRLLDVGARLREEVDGPLPNGPTATLPERIGRFRVLGEIARGGFGVVLRGQDLAIGRDVALKILPPGSQPPPRLARLLRTEGQIGGQLQHPGIVPVYELGELDDALPFVAMKVVEGRTLSSLLRERASPSVDRARFIGIFEQVCQAIAYAHARGVLHRDLKPQNLMIGAFGEVQVMDWGLAAMLATDEPDDDLERDGAVALGTPAYMAPEQARGEPGALDPRCDVFGLGAILCEILTGEPPFVGADAITTLERARAGDTSGAIERIGRCGADDEIKDLALRCLAADPGDRPEDGKQVAIATRAHLESVDQRARAAQLDAATARERAASERRSRRLTTALGAVIVLATLIGAGTWLTLDGAARDRHRVANSRLQSALFAAERVASEASAARPETALRWEAALTTALNAERLITSDTDPELARAVSDVRTRAETRLRDVRFSDVLTSIALDDRFLNTYDRGGQIDAYEKALSDFLETPFAAISVGAAHEALADFPFRDSLVSALDTWSFNIRQQDPRATRIEWLRELADGLDDDAWRRAVRAAVADEDAKRLIALAGDPASRLASPSACAFLATQLLVRGRDAAVLELLTRTAERFPSDFETALNLAFAHLAFGDRSDALRYSSVACALEPNSALPHAVMSSALWHLGRREETIRAARRAVALSADGLSPRAVAGQNLFVAGAFDEAEAIAEGYAERIPRNHAVYPVHASLLGNVRAQQRRFAEAVDAFLDAVQAPLAWPDEPSWFLQFPGMAEGLHAELLARVEGGARSDPMVLYLLARLDESTGDLRGALRLYEEVETLHPNLMHTRRRISKILPELGGRLSSMSAADRSIAGLDPTLSEADARRAMFGDGPVRDDSTGITAFVEGRLAMRAGNFDAAIGRLQRAVESDRDAMLAWSRLHEAWVAQAGRIRADTEIRALLGSGPRPSRTLPIPPTSPRVVDPADGATLAAPFDLAVDGFDAPDPRQHHRVTLWQVRDLDADYELAPSIEVVAKPGTPLTIPRGLLAPGTRYAWRAAFLVEGAGPGSDWSEEGTFQIAADAPVPVAFELADWFDRDVVADPGDASGDAFDPPNSFQLVVEGFDGTRTDAATVRGLPPDRRVRVHLLADYRNANARQIPAEPRADARVAIPEAHYAAILVLSAAANGNATMPVRVLYSDGTSDVRQWAALDWFSDGTDTRVGTRSVGMPIWRRMDRMAPGGYEERNSAGLFEAFLECDPTRKVTGLIFMPSLGRFDSPTTSANVLAITGMAIPEHR